MKNSGWNLENTYRSLPKIFYTDMELSPVKAPDLVILNTELAESLGLDPVVLEKQLDILAGNIAPPGSNPISKAYAGHQFGYFNILGDGRAILLGEQITPNGERFDIELKGSGETPYSRCGDGRSAFGPMLREYLMSEAMHELNIPTTRGLSVARTGQRVIRNKPLAGAILVRVAKSHIRVGTFEFAADSGSEDDLRSLADYTIDRHFKWIKEHENPYLSLLTEVIKVQAELIAKWQLVGFIHGVMNTDNMTLSGETIDYGPCAFMDEYRRDTVFSSIDRESRYAYGNQPQMAEWNLARLAETLIPLVHEDRDSAIEILKNELTKFKEIFDLEWLNGMRKKLGLFTAELEDKNILMSLLNIMEENNLDFTNTFRTLTMLEEDCEVFESEEMKSWYDIWKDRLTRQQESIEQSQQLMKSHNPAVIPRNLKVEEALEAAVDRGDMSVFEKLLQALKDPYDYSIQRDDYINPPTSDTNYRTYCGT